jgi:hypothetical protein
MFYVGIAFDVCVFIVDDVLLYKLLMKTSVIFNSEGT